MAGSSFSRRRGRRYGTFSEINVTPFVDVMLVLLIVFMVSAPLLATGVSVDLPDSQAKAITEENAAPLELSMDQSGDIYLGEKKIERDRLIPTLSAIMKQKDDQRIYVRADQRLTYAAVMDVLGALNGAGFNKVALISDPAP